MTEQQFRDTLIRYLANPADHYLHDTIYHDNMILEFPQSGERFVGRANVSAMREAYPAAVAFTVQRIRSNGDLSVVELVVTYDDGSPYYGLSIMELQDGKVVHETIYGGEAWERPAWRARWVEAVEHGIAASSDVGFERTRITTEQEIRTELIRHWSEPDNQAQVHEIYHDDLVLEFPQSGERLVGLANVRAMREAYQAKLTFTLQRMWNNGALWVTELVLTYDGGPPVHAVNIMEFRGDKVAHETIYFGDPWEAPAWRAPWVEKPVQTSTAGLVALHGVPANATPRPVTRRTLQPNARLEPDLTTVLGIHL